MKYSSIAVLCLVGGTSAVQRKHHHRHHRQHRPQRFHQAPLSTVQVTRDPLYSSPDRNDWAFETPAKKGPGYPQDFFVPNFGMDKEIAGTQNSIAEVENQMGHFWAPKMKPDPEPPRNYFVPNFGVDSDVKTTLGHAQTAESQYGHFWDVLAKPAPEPPRNYFVPNFGMDKEISGTQNSIADVENQMGHFWMPKMKPDPEPPRGYFVPDFGLDSDITTSLKNLNDQEKVYGPMKAELTQLEEKTDPLQPWSPKWHGKWDINYFVPNFGADGDIVASKTHTEAAEKRLDHKWEPYEETDDDGNKEWKRIPGVFTLNGRYG